MSVFQGQVITSCGDTRKTTHTPPCTSYQEVATYLTDFIDLSNLLAGLLPGDSFLLRRKASRFFMSLALSERKIDEREKEGGSEQEGKEDLRRRWRMGKVEMGQGEKRNMGERSDEVNRGSRQKRHGKKVCWVQVQSPQLKQSKTWESPIKFLSTVNPIHMKSNPQMPEKMKINVYILVFSQVCWYGGTEFFQKGRCKAPFPRFASVCLLSI